jgi:predicted small secreted protein
MRLLLIISLSALALAGCNTTDAPTAGKEVFAPLSNGAYAVRQAPLADRGYIQRRPVE